MAADTKLQEGVRYGDSNLVESSLEEGADPNAIGLYGWSAIHEAASNGDMEILEVLLQFKGDPNCRDDLEGCTPVHYAAREGHADCLRVLLKSGGRYDMENNQGHSALDDAVEECRHILDKEKTKEFLNMTLDAARSTLAKQKPPVQQTSAESEGQTSGSVASDELDSPLQQVGRITPRAWNSKKLLETKKTSGKESLSGSLQLSFEYNSKAKTFKIRVWSLQDVLLPPAEFANLSRIYIKSHLLPDKKGETKRKTDEIRIDDPTKMNNSLVTLRRKGMRDSFKAVFLPSTFKFSKPLEYQNVTQEMVANKTVHVAVCVRQRYSTKTLPVANIQLPMKEAVRRLIKEKHALHSCINYSMPDNIHAYDPHDIVVISEGMYSNMTTSHPTLRAKSGQSLEVEEGAARVSSDINLKAVRCHSVESVPSTVVEVETGSKETALDDLLEVSVERDNPVVFDPSRRDVTVVEIHGPPTPPATPLPGFTEDGELTDVSVVSSPRQSPDSATVDMGGVEMIDLNRETAVPMRSSTPTKKKPGKIKHGFANPHITIVDDVDDDDEVPDVSVGEGKRWPLDKKDAIIDIGSGSHGGEAKRKGFKGHLFKKKDRHKKGKGDGLDNPGYVVDLRTGQRSLLGQFGAQDDKKGTGDLEMLEILSDDEADAKFAAMKSHHSSSSGRQALKTTRNNNKLRETVINVGTTGQVSEAERGSRVYDVHGAMKKEYLSSRTRHGLPESRHKEETRVDESEEDPGKTIPPRPFQSPVPVIHVECIDEIDRSVSPGNKSPRSPRSPRHARKVSPVGNVSKAGKNATHQDFPAPVTHGLPHTAFSSPQAKAEQSKAARAVLPGRGEKQNSAEVNVQYVTETDNSCSSPNKTRSPKKGKESRTRSKSPGHRHKTPPAGESQIEMLTLWNDEEWRKKLATPEFKLQMFQCTSQDPHPSTPLLKKYHAGDSALAAANNPAFVPETPPSKVDGNTPPTEMNAAKVKQKILTESKRPDKSKMGGRDEIKPSSITKMNQSWL